MKIRRCVGSSIIALIAICIMAASLLANPYVKNLHKACAKDQQKCALECATTSVMSSEKESSEESRRCIRICNDAYEMCERVVTRFNRLTLEQPITQEMAPGFLKQSEIDQLNLELDKRMGRVPAEAKDD